MTLANPILYVASIVVLAMFTPYLPFLWLITGGLALMWGGWLIWLQFRHESPAVVGIELAQAQQYREQIQALLADVPTSINLLQQLDMWVATIDGLGQQLQNLRQNRLLQHDLQSVPMIVTQLESRLFHETDPLIRQQLQQNLAHRQEQWAKLRQLNQLATRTELQLEQTLTLLSAVYTNLLTTQSTKNTADYAAMSHQMSEELCRLQDYLEAYQEVYQMGGMYQPYVLT